MMFLLFATRSVTLYILTLHLHWKPRTDLPCTFPMRYGPPFHTVHAAIGEGSVILTSIGGGEPSTVGA